MELYSSTCAGTIYRLAPMVHGAGMFGDQVASGRWSLARLARTVYQLVALRGRGFKPTKEREAHKRSLSFFMLRIMLILKILILKLGA